MLLVKTTTKAPLFLIRFSKNASPPLTFFLQRKIWLKDVLKCEQIHLAYPLRLPPPMFVRLLLCTPQWSYVAVAEPEAKIKVLQMIF